MTIMRLPSVILCLTLFRVGSTCPSDCQSCDNGKVQCVSVGLSQPPTALPEDTVVIDLSQNNIQALTGLPSVPNVQSLRLPANKLERLDATDLSVAPSLMSLDLSQNSITIVDDNAFDELSDLKSISLTGNKLTSIGPIFKNTLQITSLRLGHNEITEVGEDDFKNNTMVKMLDLSSNMITTVHQDAFKNLDMLRYLILSNNPLVILPELSFTSTMLTLADFSNCQLTSVPRTMPESLKDFRLGNNRIKEIFFEDFQNLTDVTLITLNDNLIENVAHRAFGSLENLRELWLSRNQLVYIPRGLPGSLEKLYMDNNQVVQLEPTLFHSNANLKYLTLEANNVMKIHQNSLKDVPELENLNLQNNNVSLIDVGTFTNLPKLKDLILSNNPIQLFENGAFANLTDLTKLSLSHIEHAVSGPKNVLDENILEAMPKLEKLDLTISPYLTERLLEILGESKDFSSGLKTLILQYNELSNLPENIKSIFPNLETIILDGNPWKCNKKISWLRDWEKSSSITFNRFQEPTCNQPSSLHGRLLSTIQDDELSDQEEDKPVNNEAEQLNTEKEASKPAESVQATDDKLTHNQAETSPDLQEQGSREVDTQSSSQQGTSSRPMYGVRVVVKPPETSAKEQAKIQRQLDKAARRAEKERRKKERQQRRKNKKGKKRGKKNKDRRRKRRIDKKRGMRCRLDKNGLKVCRLRKRCHVLADGSVKCRKRGGKKTQSKKVTAVN